jgi:membrane associated rhomboid family serine protease
VTVLIGALDASSGSGDLDELTREYEPSADALRAMHADAQRLARGRMRLPLALLGTLFASSLAVAQPLALLMQVLAVAVAGWAFSETYEWWQIRRQTPLDLWRIDRRDVREDSAAVRENDARLAEVWPVASVALVVGVSAVTAAQLLSGGVAASISRAALVKPAVFAGEYWRLLSAVYLHANAWHWQANAIALITFGALIEAYDRRARVPLAFLAGALAGSLASTLLSSATSVGASGAALGLAGYLFAAGVGPTSAPQWMKRYLGRVFLGTAVLGVIGFLFIDNAAHVGGAAGGLAVGTIVRRVRSRAAWTAALDACGWIAAFTLIVGAIFTTGRLLQAW